MAKPCQMLAVFIVFFLCVVASHAQAIELRFPVVCQVMGNCWITDHVDLDGTEGQREDYMCGRKVSDNNKSTHISLGSLSAVQNNYPVIAADDGEVAYVGNIGGFCGGRVLLFHDGGWETSYCHLKTDSLFVRQEQKVKRGQLLGLIGMSGETKWPHLSFAVIRNGMIFDPFSGRTSLEGCMADTKPMWENNYNPPYEPAHVTSVGFSIGRPNPQKIMVGLPSEPIIPESYQSVSLWGMVMNALKGDKIHLKIIAPSGRTEKETTIIAEKDSDYMPVFIVANRGNLLWDLGRYRGEVTITRDIKGTKITTGKIANTMIIRTE